jgi:hypothetical protein
VRQEHEAKNKKFSSQGIKARKVATTLIFLFIAKTQRRKQKILSQSTQRSLNLKSQEFSPLGARLNTGVPSPQRGRRPG